MFLGAEARAGAGSEKKIPEPEHTQIWTASKSCSATFNTNKLKNGFLSKIKNLRDRKKNYLNLENVSSTFLSH